VAGCGRRFLAKVVYLADVLRCVHQLKADAFAMTAGREAPALDDRHLVRHVGVLRIVGDAVDPRLRDDLSLNSWSMKPLRL
jgi:hypothetical protein